MITIIHLENFKGIKERQTIELKPITLLFGANSAGKSTVIQALHYAREILERKNFDPDDTIYGNEGMDLGGFKNLVHGHDYKNNAIELRFDINIAGSQLPDIHHFFRHNEYELRNNSIWIEHVTHEAKTAWVTIKVHWSPLMNKPIITLYETGFNDDVIARVTPVTPMNDAQYGISFINFKHPFFYIKDGTIYSDESDRAYQKTLPYFKNMKLSDHFKKFYKETGAVKLPLWNSSDFPNFNSGIEFDGNHFESNSDHGSPDIEEEYGYCELFNKVLLAPGLLLKEYLNKFRYIGPIREIPTRTFKPNKIISEVRWKTGLGAWDLLYKSPSSFLEKVNRWMDTLKTGHNIKFKEYKELLLDSDLMKFFTQFRVFDNFNLKKEIDKIPVMTQIYLIDKSNTNIELMPADVGIGISQIIPIIVGTIDQEASMLAVEQPELHVHPAIQVSLGDLFISQIQHEVPCMKPLFLIETHSEHLMLRLLRRIEETTEKELPKGKDPLLPEQVAVNYFEHGKQGIKITHIPIDETGEFTKPWPKGFFEERAEELFG